MSLGASRILDGVVHDTRCLSRATGPTSLGPNLHWASHALGEDVADANLRAHRRPRPSPASSATSTTRRVVPRASTEHPSCDASGGRRGDGLGEVGRWALDPQLRALRWARRGGRPSVRRRLSTARPHQQPVATAGGEGEVTAGAHFPAGAASSGGDGSAERSCCQSQKTKSSERWSPESTSHATRAAGMFT